MDANGTRFHLLLGRDDWAGCSVAISSGKELPLAVWKVKPSRAEGGLSWNDERKEVTLQPRLFNFTSRDTLPLLDNRRGAGRDRYGNWYWIDETSRKVRVLSTGSGETSDFWPVQADCARREESHGDFQPRDKEQPAAPLGVCGLAVTEDHYLVVGVLEPAGLLIFDLHTGGEPRQLFWPASMPFVPFDMAPRPGGGVWILDRTNRCYWALDRHFNPIGPEGDDALLADAQADDFQPIEQNGAHGSARRLFPGSFSLLQSPLSPSDPISIEALPDGTVLILDYDPNQSFSRIYRYRFGQQLPDKISTDAILSLIEEERQSDFALTGYDIAFVPEHDENGLRVQDRLYVVAADGNQSYAFRLCLRDQKIELQPIAEYLPMRLFGGKAIVAAGSAAYYDFAENWIPLVQQRRPRYVAEATLTTPVFDGRDPDCVWHRLMLDARIPPESVVEVWSRAANEESDLPLTQWQREPQPYLRGDGTELPFLRWSQSITCAAAGNAKLGDGTWELLFQRAQGRYLQLRIRLSGDERSTPRLRALRAYYPRFSYLANYLPGVYREDEQSASFLDRFLANVEGLYTTLEDKIAAVQVLLDVRSAPKEVLDWLAGWFGVALDPSWDEPKRRMFIAHAMDFFQYRGTIRGVTMALHLALDACADETIFSVASARRQNEEIRIVEKYLTRQMPAVVLGDPTELSGMRTVTTDPSWQPSQGRASLSQRYAALIGDAANPESLQYPLVPPADPDTAAQWTEFSQTTLGFVPSTAATERITWQAFLTVRYAHIESLNATHHTSYQKFDDISVPRDLPMVEAAQQDWTDFVLDPKPVRTPVDRLLWQDFLARRYRRIKALNQAYGTKWASFETVALPDELPNDGGPLQDWFQFEAVVMLMQRTAHRFTVLLPVPASLAFDPNEHQRRLDLSRRIIELEKPAHTVFDVKFYWAMFRVGEARLQLDTIIDQGSRAPQLMPQLILGQGFVGESYLAPPVPEDANDRYILGRDPLVPTPN